jgi:hypothetical protein
VPNHDEVGLHGLDVARRVFQRLALRDRRAGRREVDRLGGEASGGQPEAELGAGGRLEEHVGDRHAPERGHLFDGTIQHVAEPAGRLQDEADLTSVVVGQAQQVTPLEIFDFRFSIFDCCFSGSWLLVSGGWLAFY